MRRGLLIVIVLSFAGAARDAAAQGFISPFIGTTLTSPSASGGSSKPGFGVAFGSLGGIVGGDVEIAYYPEILDNDANALDKSRALTFSGDTLIGPNIGAVKVYGAFGVGNLHLNVTSLASAVVPSVESLSSNYFTFNAGGGVAGFFGPHVGVRGDLRYFRAFGFDVSDLEGAGLALDDFDFWRAAIGLAIKF